MIDFNIELSIRALQSIQEDTFLWLTTIDAIGFPQPRPVWFIWDEETFLIYSQPNTRKLQQIEHNPNVSIRFDGGSLGFDVQVILATAEIIINPTPVHQATAYLQKYHDLICQMWASEDVLSKELSVAIRLHPTLLCGTVAPE